MSRKPKPKNTLSAGQRATLYEQEQKKRFSELSGEEKALSEQTESQVEPTVPKNPVSQKNKEKPQIATVKVNLDATGDKINSLHGVCNGPLSQYADTSGLFKKAKVPYIRFDKTEGARCGYVVDISKIFPNFEADERDPKNYCFRETDKYILAAANTGAQIIYRLGESFDCDTPEHKFTLPENLDKLTAICVNIIRHYNDYFCGGFALGIKCFEIFSHVDMQSVREKNTDSQIFELYTRIANGIKLYDDSLKVGGMSFSSCGQFLRDFIKYCKKKNAPVDFVSVSLYASSPEEMGEEIEKYRGVLKNSGYANAELMVDEWAYLPASQGKQKALAIMSSVSADTAAERKELFDKLCSVEGAAFVASGLLKMLEYPEIKVACLYNAEAGRLWCPICDTFGLPRKPYFALESFGSLAYEKDSLVCISEQSVGFAHTGVYAAAARDEAGACIMLSAFDGCTSIDLRLDNIPDNFYTADIYMLDGVKNMELCYTVQLSGMKKRMLLSVSPYSVVLIKIY